MFPLKWSVGFKIFFFPSLNLNNVMFNLVFSLKVVCVCVCAREAFNRKEVECCRADYTLFLASSNDITHFGIFQVKYLANPAIINPSVTTDLNYITTVLLNK